MVQIREGKKAISFDGFFIEIYGTSRLGKRQRFTTDQIEQLAMSEVNGELLLIGKLPMNGGFRLAFSMEKRVELEHLANEILAYRRKR